MRSQESRRGLKVAGSAAVVSGYWITKKSVGLQTVAGLGKVGIW